MKRNRTNAAELFEVAKQSVRDGDVHRAISFVTAASLEGHAEARSVNAVIFERYLAEKAKSCESLQQLMCQWLQSAESPLQASIESRQELACSSQGPADGK